MTCLYKIRVDCHASCVKKISVLVNISIIKTNSFFFFNVNNQI